MFKPKVAAFPGCLTRILSFVTALCTTLVGSVNNTWELNANVPWTARAAHNVVLFRGRAVLLGGSDGVASASADVWSSTDGSDWTRLGNASNASFTPRLGGASGSDASAIILSGGAIFNTTPNGTKLSNASFLNDVWRSDDGGSSWALILSAAPWSPRAGHACTRNCWAGASGSAKTGCAS